MDESKMNEQIQLLSIMARSDARSNKHYLERVHNREITAEEYQEMYDQKFAELIVSKCIALMDVNYRGDMYTGDVFACEYNNCINEQVETLEDYFGVNK
tara:strand:+ start:2817 stop:3113 length:297 start_codon:yes stop_codon:yes gene_type:complete